MGFYWLCFLAFTVCFFWHCGSRPTAVPQIIFRDMDWKHLAETVSRRDADAEPPWTGSRRVSARCFRFMSVVNNGFRQIHWHRDKKLCIPTRDRGHSKTCPPYNTSTSTNQPSSSPLTAYCLQTHKPTTAISSSLK